MTPTVSSLVGSNRNINSSSKTSETPDAASRRAYKGIAANVTAPDGDVKGIATKGRAELHVIVKNLDAGGSFDVLVWGKHEISQEWVLIEEASPGVAFETAGTWSIPAGLKTHARILHISGIERVFLQFNNFALQVNGADAWLGSVGGFASADR